MRPASLPSSSLTDLACPQDVLARSRRLRQWTTWWTRRAAEIRRESCRLRQHARVLRAHSQYWRQHYFLVECTWCQKPLSWQYMAKPLVLPIADVLPTSHGACPSCFETQLRELRRRKPRSPWATSLLFAALAALCSA